MLLVGGCDQGQRPEPEPARLTSGPLQVPPSYTAWFVVRDDEIFSDGFDVLSSREDIRIDAVSAVADDAHAPEFLGARIGLPGRPDDFNQRMEGYPPSAVPARFQIDAEGAELKAGETYMLILGFQVSGDEPSVRDGIRIDYTADDIQYTAVFESRVVVCPRPLTEAKCSARFPANDM